MLNLLPNELRAKHKRRTLNRAALLWGGAMLVLLMTGIATLIPAYEYVHVGGKKDATQKAAEQKSHERSENMQAELTNYELMARNLSILAAKPLFSQAKVELEYQFGQHPEITFSDMVLARSDDVITVAVRGSAETREALVALVRSFETSTLFQPATLPVSDLAGRDGLFPFSINIKTKKQKI